MNSWKVHCAHFLVVEYAKYLGIIRLWVRINVLTLECAITIKLL